MSAYFVVWKEELTWTCSVHYYMFVLLIYEFGIFGPSDSIIGSLVI